MTEPEGKFPGGWQLNCPVSVRDHAECVTLAHGEGGRLSRKLIQDQYEGEQVMGVIRTVT